jgi:lysophospholipase L1-like esterase/pimeloyl-ACP methyl ester carboxylesterase
MPAYLLLILILLSETYALSAQANWPAGCQKIEIPSTADQSLQPAYFYPAQSAEARPLIVSLHTWSNGYDQQDSLAWISAALDYNYIHPDFRGPNNRPEAGGSELVIRDIDDAIDYALREAKVTPSGIHVIGHSGGGHATLLMYMRSRHAVSTFSAWVPISNLEDWYYESVGRGQKYAHDIAKVTNPEHAAAGDYDVNRAVARQRSPYFMLTPIHQRQNSKLFIYAGIHDGYTGSVPITQSLKFYNKVVQDFDPEHTASLVSKDDMLALLSRNNPKVSHPSQAEKGLVHYQQRYQDKVQVTIFEGGHEILYDRALDHVANEKILAIGDSNGALEYGWVTQLRKLRFSDRVYNTCISGNTIGFDNLGRRSLNTLVNIDAYMNSALAELGGLDRIIILLGTNDCKAVFDDSLELVPKNMELLIRRIKSHPAYQKFQPRIYIVSPPPYAPDEQLIPKYYGGAADVAWLFPRFREVAERSECRFIDVYSHLLPDWAALSADGIHLSPEGQGMLARLIVENWSSGH